MINTRSTNKTETETKNKQSQSNDNTDRFYKRKSSANFSTSKFVAKIPARYVVISINKYYYY